MLRKYYIYTVNVKKIMFWSVGKKCVIEVNLWRSIRNLFPKHMVVVAGGM